MGSQGVRIRVPGILTSKFLKFGSEKDCGLYINEPRIVHDQNPADSGTKFGRFEPEIRNTRVQNRQNSEKYRWANGA